MPNAAKPYRPRRGACSSLLAALLLAAAPLTPPVDGQAVSPAGAEPRATAEDERIRHVLARLSYGPRPGDVARVRAIGIEAYIDEQLHPEDIDDADARARLAGYPALGLDRDALRAYDLPSTPLAVRRRSTAVEKGTDPALTRAALGDRQRMRAGFLNTRVTARVRAERRDPVAYAGTEIRLMRAVYSERQLLELMVDFWMNHFNIQFGDSYLLNDFEENAIRPRALGSFHDLLVATAQHPAMLIYLDNWLSSAPEDAKRGRTLGGEVSLVEGAVQNRARAGLLDQAQGLNENYGRELMELHTLGVDGGYTQEDVVQVARAFTGWTLSGWVEDVPDGDFVFEPTLHLGGDKTVLGRRIPAGGVDEGLAILHMLARHPSTARYVSTKLVRRFVADDPPQDVVEAAARTFLETEGEIRAVLRTILTHPTFYSAEVRGAKIKKPIEIVASALRAVDADIDPRFGVAGFTLDGVMTRMGERLYQHEAPDGYPDVAEAWVSTNGMFQRLKFAMELARGQLPSIVPDVEAAEALFRELGYDPISGRQVAAARRLLADGGDAVVGGGGMMGGEDMMNAGAEPSSGAFGYSETGDASMMRVVAPPSEAVAAMDDRAVAVALLLGSPRFQKR